MLLLFSLRKVHFLLLGVLLLKLVHQLPSNTIFITPVTITTSTSAVRINSGKDHNNISLGENDFEETPKNPSEKGTFLKWLRRTPTVLQTEASQPSNRLSCQNRTAINSSVISKYRATMSPTDREIMRDILKTFVEIISSPPVNLTYMMYGGTLLGSYRHHGLVPWDDDVDLLLPYDEQYKLYSAMKPLHPKYELRLQPLRWKFFSQQKSTAVDGVKWKYPFLDISFYKESADEMWDMDPWWEKKRFRYKKSSVFPLQKRPFLGLLLNSPRNIEEFLTQTYDDFNDVCMTSTYSHQREHPLANNLNFSIPCCNLWSLYPFVFRTANERMDKAVVITETLRIGDNVSGSWTSTALGKV